MRKFAALVIAICAILIYQNCSETNFALAPKNNSSGGNPDDPVRVIQGPIDYTLVCGSSREQGKHLRFENNGCTMPATTDESCDRWGCTVMTNTQGDADCEPGTDKVYTDTEPVYFLCLRRVRSETPVEEVCGGARIVGKLVDYGFADCTSPVTADNTCNLWGCAVKLNDAGDANCPANTRTVRTHDGPTSILCLQ
ncbi:MAG: hypothetical protein ABL958_02360 [Bdellovibrionia bacterium]